MPQPLKDHVDAEVVDTLAGRFSELWPPFDTASFRHAIMSELDALELKDRIALIADVLADHLPDDYEQALALVTRVARTEVGEWGSWPLCTFVERHGLEYPKASLDAMPALTRYWSCEFAIRPFLRRHLPATRAQLRAWVRDDDPAVRRLASEGTRPLLPWGQRVGALQDDPRIGIELLTELRHDPSETVRRSVANHLNDIAKAHPDLVVRLLRGWADDGVDAGLLRHASRTLVKAGHAGALDVLGFTVDPEIEVIEFDCAPAAIAQGGSIDLTAELRSTGAGTQKLVVDFVIHHVTASGRTSPKVFKWTTVTLEPGETAQLRKRRTIVDGSTRTYTPGRHRIELQIAGRLVAETSFLLED